MKKLIAVANEGLADENVPVEGWCWKCGCFCPFLPPKEAGDIHLEAGGNTCVSFSPQGGQARWIHPSGSACAIWLAWCKKHVDALFQECSHLFNTEDTLEEAFPWSDGWSSTTLQLAAKDVGVPMNRLRKWSWTLRHSTLQLCVHLDRNLFMRCCSSPVQVSGHDFFVLDGDQAESYMKELNMEKQLHEIGGRQFISPGSSGRLEGYEALLAGLPNTPPPILDLSQNVAVRDRLSSWAPSLLCHSVLWSCKHERKMICPEMFLLMGWPVHLEPICHQVMKGDKSEFPWDPQRLFTMLSEKAQCKLLGNSFHARLVGQLMMLLLSVTGVCVDEKAEWQGRSGRNSKDVSHEPVP